MADAVAVVVEVVAVVEGEHKTLGMRICELSKMRFEGTTDCWSASRDALQSIGRCHGLLSAPASP